MMHSNKLWRIAIALMMVMLMVAAAVNGEIEAGGFKLNDIQSQLPSELSNINITVDDVKQMVRDKCVDVAGKEKGEEAFTTVEAGFLTMTECIPKIINITTMQQDIERMKPTGDLDTVFHSYCNRSPEALDCIKVFNGQLAPCLDEDEQATQDVVMRIFNRLLQFVCRKDGDQIALFIAEKGPQCLESKQEGIQQCISATFSVRNPQDLLANATLPKKFIIGDKECRALEEFQDCVVKELTGCPDTTPANIVESLFTYVRKTTVCQNTPTATKNARTSSATAIDSLRQAVGAVVAVTAIGTVLSSFVFSTRLP